MADVSARSLIEDALTEINILASGETLSAEDASFGLRALNRVLDQMAAERLMIHKTTRTTWTIATSTQNYTVGSSATINVVRPTYLDRVNFIDTSVSSTVELPLLSTTDAEWQGIVDKGQTAELPIRWYYNPTYPTGTLSLWPIPTSSTLTGVLYAPQQVAEATGLSTTMQMPAGYREMMVTRLAVRLAPSYGRQVSPALGSAMSAAEAVVKRSNHRIREVSFPTQFQDSGTFYDIETDE